MYNFLSAAANLQDVNVIQIYRIHELSGKRSGTYALDVDGKSCPLRMIIKPEVNEQSSKKANIVDYYTSICVITIREISNHYE